MDAEELSFVIAPEEPAASADHSARGHILRRLKPSTIAVAVVAMIAIAASAFVAVAQATDSPGFCGSACHEMSPYHEAWARGAHKGVACVECHIDSNPLARLTHKAQALQEVADHVKGAPKFPLAKAPDVPDSRCLRCHATIADKVAGFSHANHAKHGSCVKCHADAGHNVATLALEQAGILDVAYRHAVEPTTSALPGSGSADIPGHISVGCSSCHDMAAMKCVDCHAPNPTHGSRPTDCATCHTPGPKFVFTHPARTDCASCHTPPKILKPPHSWKGACGLCHLSGPGIDWKFTHPQLLTCGDCHTPPSSHSWAGACASCHQAGPGKSFAFTHPARSDCETCHVRPANHRSGECTTCHRNRGVSWAFSHPSSSATCSDCHSRPSGHRSGACQTCHRNAGKSWAFTHPSANAKCTSCHSAPANHYGTNCASCHTPGTTWANTHFAHPAIPGGRHTYQSFACANCHPSGPPAHYCTCHNSATGPRGD